MFQPYERSLKDVLGTHYCEQLVHYNAVVHGVTENDAIHLIEDKIDFYPSGLERELDDQLPLVGKEILTRFNSDMNGAATDSFQNATNTDMSPIGGKGFYRIGENGKVYFTGKSEHYHVPLGHNFPGYKLLRNARDLGIVNATHNNTRGYVTRLLEQELIRIANGIDKKDEKRLKAVLDSEAPHVLNRVINLETGSLAAEAGVKMMLSRFYKIDNEDAVPKYNGKTPVLFVMGDDFGGSTANYHGTTILLQTTRGLWPGLSGVLKDAGILEVVPVKINDIADFRLKMAQHDCGGKKVAGFLHEIVLMNYGAITLTKEYLQEAYDICHRCDVPVLVDEIQSCIWYKDLFLFRNYGLDPDFVIIGKGFPGGEYPASKILTTKEMDSLSQFGALVTNGQEEHASLAYLITMEFALHNAEVTGRIGNRYFNGLKGLAEQYAHLINKIEGIGYLAGIHFCDINHAIAFADALNSQCIDVSVHGYKSISLPAMLTKLPLITTDAAVDFILGKMHDALDQMQ